MKTVILVVFAAIISLTRLPNGSAKAAPAGALVTKHVQTDRRLIENVKRGGGRRGAQRDQTPRGHERSFGEKKNRSAPLSPPSRNSAAPAASAVPPPPDHTLWFLRRTGAQLLLL